jgi:alkanesulfonate monooxygenase SsuD/methylene tetrahydromethanopterin reductase-like flavin-dependent oxidoreductase (luciferase family)
MRLYRETFRPSKYLSEPYAMAGLNVVAADTDAEAQRLFSSLQQMFVNLRTGNPGKLPPPVEGYEESLDWQGKAVLRHALSSSIVGAPQTIAAGLSAFIDRTGVDEVIITGSIHDHQARLRSFEIAAGAL